MNGIDNLALYKTVDELQESKNSIERRTGIDFSKNVQQFDLLLDIIGEETPETEEKRQVEVVEQILEAVWPKNLFEAYCSDKDNIVQAVYSNMIAIVLFSLKYLLADEIIEDEYDLKLQRWLDMESGEEAETFECYERMKRTVSNKIKKIAKNVQKSKDDYEQNLRLPIQLPQSTHKKEVLKSLIKTIVEMEANSAQENGDDCKSDSKRKKRTNSISWNILKLAEKEKNVANFKKINANERRSIKKIYETLCREITEVSMRKVEDYDQLNKSCTDTISAKMRQLEYKDNIDYNKKAVNAYNSAFTSFKNNESRYKDKSQLFSLVSTTLFAYDAGRLFNETLIFYNHVYSYIFNKLDDNGKLELTKYSIECERKQG